MNATLQIVNTNELSETTRYEIDAQIDQIISKHKNNRYEINKLVFESVSALTASRNYSNELASQGILKRFWGGITGKNRELQNKIDRELAASQYASQQTLQKLAEQNLMSFELITAVNNKLNSSIIQIENEINKVYATLVTFFKQTKSDIIQLENRVERLEKNVSLLNWQNSIEYQMWDGTEYAELDEISKIICIARDFYDITKARWTTSDLLLLKAAMSAIGISPKADISYKQFIGTVSGNEKLMQKLFDGINIESIEQYPKYIAISAGIKKRILLDTDEKYLVDNTVELMKKRSFEVTESEIGEELLEIYERDGAQINIENSVYAYDLVLEILYNLEQIKEIQYVKKLEDKLKEAELLFSVYDTKKLIPLLEELIKYGYTKAKYMMALLYETGCADLKRDDEKCDELLEQCINDNYLPAIVRKVLPFSRSADKKMCIETIPEILGELEKSAKSGDIFANEECARVYVNVGFFELNCSKEEGYKKAIQYFKEAPLVLCDFGIAKRYDNGQGVEKDYAEALQLYLRCANYGYAAAEYEVGEAYENGWGTEKNPERAFQYYMRAYEHGDRDAINKCGWCLTNNFGTKNDYDRAFKFFKEGDELGIGICSGNLGWCYQWGRGVEKNINMAKQYYQKGASLGSDWSKKQLEEYF